eukprot:3868783-Pleurochrysis_carterae.AAC.1
MDVGRAVGWQPSRAWLSRKYGRHASTRDTKAPRNALREIDGKHRRQPARQRAGSESCEPPL